MNRIFYIALFAFGALNAQFGPQQIISTEGNGPNAVYFADLDGDSYVDVMSANRLDYTVTWYKNLGDGSFGPQQVVASINQPFDVYAADLDGDEDMDILSLSPADNTVVWYENLDGLGSFGPERVIANDALFSFTVRAADLDGDNDLDVLSGTDSSGLAWYENLDGLGNFGPKQAIDASLPNARSVAAVDLDGDDDLDVVSSSSGSVTVSWYENLDGQGSFGPQRVVAGSALFVQSIYAADLDGDLDVDIVAATPALDKVAWFENQDGLGNFGPENLVTTQADFAFFTYAADLDNDTDIDLLSASSLDNKVAWYENLDGQGNFGPQSVLTTDAVAARSVYAADLDNDGDLDVLSASQNDNKVAWYENLTILGTADLAGLGIRVYPNPIKEVLVVESPIPLLKVRIYSITGARLLEVTGGFDRIPMGPLPTGILLVELETGQGRLVQQLVKE